MDEMEEQDSKLVSLHGYPLLPPGDADPNIIRYLEALLEDARSGHIRALAYVAMKGPDIRRSWFCIHPPLGNALIGAVRRLESEILSAVESESE